MSITFMIVTFDIRKMHASYTGGATQQASTTTGTSASNVVQKSADMNGPFLKVGLFVFVFVFVCL